MEIAQEKHSGSKTFVLCVTCPTCTHRDLLGIAMNCLAIQFQIQKSLVGRLACACGNPGMEQPGKVQANRVPGNNPQSA
jgi:hypothetical protein